MYCAVVRASSNSGPVSIVSVDDGLKFKVVPNRLLQPASSDTSPDDEILAESHLARIGGQVHIPAAADRVDYRRPATCQPVVEGASKNPHAYAVLPIIEKRQGSRPEPAVGLHFAVVVPRPRLGYPEGPCAREPVGRHVAPDEHAVTAGAIASSLKAQIVGFEAGTHAPERSVHTPESAVSIQIDAARESAQPGAGRIECYVWRIGTLEYRCGARCNDSMYSAEPRTWLEASFPVTTHWRSASRNRWPSAPDDVRVTRQGIFECDGVESARHGGRNEARGSSRAKIALHTTDEIVGQRLDCPPTIEKVRPGAGRLLLGDRLEQADAPSAVRLARELRGAEYRGRAGSVDEICARRNLGSSANTP